METSSYRFLCTSQIDPMAEVSLIFVAVFQDPFVLRFYRPIKPALKKHVCTVADSPGDRNWGKMVPFRLLKIFLFTLNTDVHALRMD